VRDDAVINLPIIIQLIMVSEPMYPNPGCVRCHLR
jgi:hypothetical protein